jgi:acyl-CoA reductase-like NAD-dependent aldehyde dehydrogenase
MGVFLTTKSPAHYKMYIEGRWKKSEEDRPITINPATGQVIATVARGTKQDAKRSLEAEQRARQNWKDVPPVNGAFYLFGIAELIGKSREGLARILPPEGNSIESRLDMYGSAVHFEYFAEFAKRLEGDILPICFPKQFGATLGLPTGVVASITPWNFPYK